MHPTSNIQFPPDCSSNCLISSRDLTANTLAKAADQVGLVKSYWQHLAVAVLFRHETVPDLVVVSGGARSGGCQWWCGWVWGQVCSGVISVSPISRAGSPHPVPARNTGGRGDLFPATPAAAAHVKVRLTFTKLSLLSVQTRPPILLCGRMSAGLVLV